MNLLASLLMFGGSVIALLAGIGLLRFDSAYARFHAAGKASPVAFLVASLGAALEIGAIGAAYLIVAAAAMTVTLPLGVHLLFQAHHHSSPADHLAIDRLRDTESEDPNLT